MIRILFNSSLRFFLKEKFYSIINVVGLSLGVAAAFIILQYVYNEVSYDTHHPKVENTYRVNQTDIWSTDGGMMGSSVLPLASALTNEYPQITSTLRINTPGNRIITAEGNTDSFLEQNILAADSTFFDFFGFALSSGNPKTALTDINTAVISHDIALKYFGNESAFGKTLLLGEERVPVKVTGVLAKEQPLTHFDFEILLSMYTNQDCKDFEWSWIWTQVVTYVKVDGNIEPIQNSLNQIVDKYSQGSFQRLGIDLEEFENEKGEYTFNLQPVKDIHLYSRDIENRLGTDGDILYVRTFTIVAFVILVLACINFINLSTARAVFRAKEIGIKKVLGSSKKLLMGQLMLESLMISTMATALGLGLAEVIKIGMENWLGIAIIQSFSLAQLAILFVSFSLILGFTAGSYPAFYLTRFSPVNVLIGQVSGGTSGSFFRNGLVVFQFTIAIVLMICTLVVYEQLTFFQESNMGFKKDNVLVIPQTDRLGEAASVFVDRIDQLASVSNTMIASTVPGFGNPEDLFSESGNTDRKISMGTIKISDDYISGLGIELISGRNFKAGISEPGNIIINELAAKSFGWTPEEAIGKKLTYYEPEFIVIGVVKNFHTTPLYYEMMPLALFDHEAPIFNSSKHLMITLSDQNVTELVNQVEKSWKQINADLPFNYYFLDKRLASFYESEDQLSKLFIVFTCLALSIGGIGLFGLSAFVASRRAKEIGIRKVLGASVKQLAVMVNITFSKLVVISCLVAAPLAWWLMDQWLQGFTYHISIELQGVFICLIIVIVFTWLVASYHSVKAAIVDPVKSLRDE